VRVLLALLLFAPLTSAQRVVNARAGMIYYAEGIITVNGQSVRSTGRPPLLQVGQVAASPRGHAEILLGPDAVLWTGTGAEVRLDSTSIAEAHVSLLAGSVMIEIKRTTAGNRLQIQVGNRTAEVRQVGIYRLDLAPLRMRTFNGEIVLREQNTKAIRGQEIADDTLHAFDRRDTDEFLYWSALRSLTLERDSGIVRQWKRKGDNDVTHSGFDVTFPRDLAAARIKYLAASASGVVYAIDGEAAERLPLRIGQANAVRTRNAKAEIFLGIGIVAYVADNSVMRVEDVRARTPAIAIEEGKALIEVAASRESPLLRVRIGETTTHLLTPGVYEVDAQSGTLLVYRGESETQYNGSPFRAREGQSINVKQPTGASLFDRKDQDALFHWAADSSFRLYRSQGAFMTGWVMDIIARKAKHKVFGQRDDYRPPRFP
jgi:hypothetical protein